MLARWLPASHQHHGMKRVLHQTAHTSLYRSETIVAQNNTYPVTCDALWYFLFLFGVFFCF